MKSYIGGEYERGTFHPDGTIANKGIDLINDPKTKSSGSPYLNESTEHQFEWNSSPATTITQFRDDFLSQEQFLASLQEKYEIISIPTSENGAGGRSNRNESVNYVTHAYDLIFGPGTLNLLRPWSGIHYHIDMSQERFADQFNALSALAMVSGAISSSSPINYQGKNGVNCQRHDYIRNKIFNSIPEERGYISDEQELIDRDQRRFQAWRRAYRNSVGNTNKFDERFTIGRTGYVDVRRRPNKGRGTLELRTDDSTIAELFIGNAALVKGFNDRILERAIPINITDNKKHQFHAKGIVLPSWKYLEHLNSSYIQDGLQSAEVQQFLGQLEEFARQGLEREEQHHLDPVREVIHSGENIATLVLDHIKKSGHSPNREDQFTQQALKEANLYVWKLQQESIARLRKKSQSQQANVIKLRD